jgi:hypothetical protein
MVTASPRVHWHSGIPVMTSRGTRIVHGIMLITMGRVPVTESPMAHGLAQWQSGWLVYSSYSGRYHADYHPWDLESDGAWPCGSTNWDLIPARTVPAVNA